MGLDATGIGEVATGVKDIVGMLFGDKSSEEQAKIANAYQLVQLQAQANTAQIAVNQAAETGSGTTFRDGAGWVCVAGLAATVLKPLIEWATALCGHPIILPTVDTTTTGTMLAGLLGLGAMHMNESIKSQ